MKKFLHFIGCSPIYTIKAPIDPVSMRRFWSYEVDIISTTYRLFWIKLFTIKTKKWQKKEDLVKNKNL